MSNNSGCETKIVYCKGQHGEKCCNNPIGARNGSKLTIKRHNREIHIILLKGQSVEIVCEKCGHKTVIKV